MALQQLVHELSVASCQQTCCKLIVKTCYPHACCKLFQQVVTSLQMASYNEPDFNRRVAKIDNLQQVCDSSISIICDIMNNSHDLSFFCVFFIRS